MMSRMSSYNQHQPPPIDAKISVPRIPTSYLNFTQIQNANNSGLTYLTPLVSSPVIPHHQPKQKQQNNISHPKIITPSSPLCSFPCLVSLHQPFIFQNSARELNPIPNYDATCISPLSLPTTSPSLLSQPSVPKMLISALDRSSAFIG
jgi:hypothetical protein